MPAHKLRTGKELSESAFDAHLINHLGVSPDIRFVSSFLYRMGITAAALAERKAALVPHWHHRDTLRRHYELQNKGSLPPHLQDRQAFVRRHEELFGKTPGDIATNEIVTSIVQQRPKVDKNLQNKFEKNMASTYGTFLNFVARESPEMLAFTARDTTFGILKEGARHVILSGDGLRAQLPVKHDGVVQYAPTFGSALRRCEEVSSDLPNVGLLSSNPFNEELSRVVGQDIFGVPQDHIFASGNGIAEGAADLAQQRAANNQLARGFGAVILSAVHHLPNEEIFPAIHQAPNLLAPGGLLVISDLERFSSQEGSVWEMIREARAALNAEPAGIGPMTTDDGRVGRQALFIAPSQ